MKQLMLTLLAPAALFLSMTGCGSQKVIASSVKVERGADLNELAGITPEEARAAALVRYPGATAGPAQLEDAGGYLFYEVDVQHGSQEVEVLVDAGNGAIRMLEWRR